MEGLPPIARRIAIPFNTSSPAGLIEANTVDPFSESGKYALGWVYFCIILLVVSAALRFYFLWGDVMRTGWQQEWTSQDPSPIPLADNELEASVITTDKSTHSFFPRFPLPHVSSESEPKVSTDIRAVNLGIAFMRFLFYRPIPVIPLKRGWRPIVFPSRAVVLLASVAFIFVVLYCFVPRPLYWQSIRFGSPPLAVRAGMIAVALMPWIIATSMKANMISIITGIGHERLNVLHRWMSWLCLFLSLVHTVPFYVTPVDGAMDMRVFRAYFESTGTYVYGTGIAALVPLFFLVLHSLPWVRLRFYELFLTLHVPVSIVFLGMLFWHCHDYLTSWHYLLATTALWVLSYLIRLFYLNWTNPWRMSWLIGEEASVVLLPENALKITIPTQTRWRPGQYVYLRMPGISIFGNHPFTVASLCSKDFPSQYGEEHRDMVLVVRPFAGFTNKLLESAIEKGPYHTYRAFIDGPYGGMRRRIESFDTVVLIAGGSGITSIASQLLDLVKRMRDGKAVTKRVQLIWAIRRPEILEWFKEELRICRTFAPPESVQCQFYITTARRQDTTGTLVSVQTPTRPISTFLRDQINHAFQDIAEKRHSAISSSKRLSAFIRDEAGCDLDREKELRRENEDKITALPEAHAKSSRSVSRTHPAPEDIPPVPSFSGMFQSTEAGPLPHPHPLNPAPSSQSTSHRSRKGRDLSIDITKAETEGTRDPSANSENFPFGFPSTPTELQKNLMRFAFMPTTTAFNGNKKDGWSVEYGRPDIPFLLRENSANFGKRTCVFVCGPPGMRNDVSRTVAELQRCVWGSKGAVTTSEARREEIFLHTENYAL